MSKSYVIQWKSKSNGRAGRGNKVFTREEAERLATELNREYPDIMHEPMPAESAAPPPSTGGEARSGNQSADSEDDLTPTSSPSR